MRLRLREARYFIRTEEVRGPPASLIIENKADYKADFESRTFLTHPRIIT